MNDPLRPLDKPAPRRAEPLQPDDPTSGSDAEQAPENSDSWKAASDKRAEEQAKTARENNDRS